jgi:pilus assembly protein Flp/PilA
MTGILRIKIRVWRETRAMTKLAREFLADDSGATAIEYGLIASLVSIGVIAALKTVGSGLITVYNQVATNLI